ncbi:hypothetical protein AAHA92_29381 [Salvia divinorum]|uniref:Uncharacterized protein n=1 Tax=Salvia divinorum TaxID=28513 RepID=A0ABD1FY78_SALDI
MSSLTLVVPIQPQILGKCSSSDCLFSAFIIYPSLHLKLSCNRSIESNPWLKLMVLFIHLRNHCSTLSVSS